VVGADGAASVRRPAGRYLRFARGGGGPQVG